MNTSRTRLAVLLCLSLSLTTTATAAAAFVAPDVSRHHSARGVNQLPKSLLPYSTKWRQTLSTPQQVITPTTTALPVWWFGGTETADSQDGDSCELVAVRIEKPSSSSRRVFGEITVQAPLMDVWAILTDYDRLSVHVPNLIESRRTSQPVIGQQGDGSYSCRLFQRGAQKIVGFEFGASVTMDMQEEMKSGPTMRLPGTGSKSTAHTQDAGGASYVKNQRKIGFKCVDSFFFSAFDGEWVVKEQAGPTGQMETLLSYVVEVRPKGPVPVAALEWRIREDVPTNLRAVKAAAMSVGYEGVMATRQPRQLEVAAAVPAPAMSASASASDPKVRVKAAKQRLGRFASTVRSSVQWDRSETMAAYLKE